MTATPEPVSSAPDTDDFPLRQQIAKTLNRARLDVAANDNLVIDLVKALNELVSLVAEREAGLRADLDRTRAELADYAEQYAGQREELTRLRQERAAIELQHGREVDALHVEIKRLSAEVERLGLEIQSYQVDGPYQRGHEHGQQARQAEVDQARAEVARLTEVYDRTHEALRGLLPEPGVAGSLDDVPISHLVVRLARQVARVSGARPIPDDAAERLRKFAAGLQAEETDSEPDRGDWLQGHDAGLTEASVRAGNDLMALLADLGATPTTGPAPAAAASEVPIEVVRRIKAEALVEARDAARAARRLCWAENREQEVIRHYGGMAGWLATRAKAIEAGEEPDWPDAAYITPPTAPQAPAEPTDKDFAATLASLNEQARLVGNLPSPHLAAHEDTAPPDDYGDNLGGWNRAAAPTPANPTPEEEQ